MENVKKKRGRPVRNIERGRQYRVTLSDEEFDDINNLMRITGKTKADVFREALRIYKNLELSKLPDEDFDDEYAEYDDF